MAVITIGDEAKNRGYAANANVTWITAGSVANDTGILDTFEIWMQSTGDITVGTFSKSNSNFTGRDYEYIGRVSQGSKQTFTGKNCDVESGDYLGGLCTTGKIERDISGYTGIYYYEGDGFGGTQTYDYLGGDAISIYATGETAAAGNPYYYYLQQ